ncbi:MAG: hypothetical protein AAFY17_10160 [Cyanobacteria bacterium J06642_11]
MNQASSLLFEWVHFNYEIEPDHLEPWDDHWRPWKAETFQTIVDVLGEVRSLPPELPVWLAAHDMGPEMRQWAHAGVAKLNSAAVAEQWLAARGG